MFGFLKRQQERRVANARQDLLNEFGATVLKVAGTPEATQAAVGTAISQARRDFNRRFVSIAAFQQRPITERHAYLEELTVSEVAERRPASKVGIGIFKMYAGFLVRPEDRDTAAKLHDILDDFMRKGAPPT